MANSKILTAEQEKTLRQPIEEYVGKIQKDSEKMVRQKSLCTRAGSKT